MTKRQAKKLVRRDFIPGGPRVDLKDLQWRGTHDYEILQCCFKTGYDTQSGPFYCGDIADYVSFFDDGSYVGACDLHYGRFKKKARSV